MLQKILNREIWQIIPDLEINWEKADYWVLNERAVRATAGIMFAMGFFSVLTTYYTKEYHLIKALVLIFFIDFFIKVFFWPKFSPISKIWSFLVSWQKPEYVWAIQKRFAWSLGLIISFLMINIVWFFEIRWTLPLTFCGICLILMWMESALWICVWCKIYWFLEEKWIIKRKTNKPACPWWACSLKKK